MNHYASKELATELSHLIDWLDTDTFLDKAQTPAYTIGYLLTKMPKFIDSELGHSDAMRRLTIQPLTSGNWCASYDYASGGSSLDSFDNDPTNALCKLAIALVKKGIIKA